jgi:hypothetical protein
MLVWQGKTMQCAHIYAYYACVTRQDSAVRAHMHMHTHKHVHMHTYTHAHTGEPRTSPALGSTASREARFLVKW